MASLGCVLRLLWVVVFISCFELHLFCFVFGLVGHGGFCFCCFVGGFCDVELVVLIDFGLGGCGLGLAVDL